MPLFRSNEIKTLRVCDLPKVTLVCRGRCKSWIELFLSSLGPSTTHKAFVWRNWAADWKQQGLSGRRDFPNPSQKMAGIKDIFCSWEDLGGQMWLKAFVSWSCWQISAVRTFSLLEECPHIHITWFSSLPESAQSSLRKRAITSIQSIFGAACAEGLAMELEVLTPCSKPSSWNKCCLDFWTISRYYFLSFWFLPLLLQMITPPSLGPQNCTPTSGQMCMPFALSHMPTTTSKGPKRTEQTNAKLSPLMEGEGQEFCRRGNTRTQEEDQETDRTWQPCRGHLLGSWITYIILSLENINFFPLVHYANTSLTRPTNFPVTELSFFNRST